MSDLNTVAEKKKYEMSENKWFDNSLLPEVGIRSHLYFLEIQKYNL